jgi:hypothetical protein
LTDELQGKPTSKGADTWIAVAQSHREFFRIHEDAKDKTPRVTLISRHVLENDATTGKRPPLSPEVTTKLAISMHDRAVQKDQRFQYLLVIAGTIIVAFIGDFR